MSNSVLPVLLVAFCLGGLTGLRAFTPLTVLAWTMHFRWIRLDGSPFWFLHTLAACIVLTLLALGELYLDKRPGTPSRLKLPGMTGRICFGFLCGYIAGEAWGAKWQVAAVFGLVGAVIGAVAGYEVRKGMVHAIHWHDLPVALLEDLVAIGGSILLISRALFLAY